jgi:hypothetical protein
MPSLTCPSSVERWRADSTTIEESFLDDAERDVPPLFDRRKPSTGTER